MVLSKSVQPITTLLVGSAERTGAVVRPRKRAAATFVHLPPRPLCVLLEHGQVLWRRLPQQGAQGYFQGAQGGGHFDSLALETRWRWRQWRGCMAAVSDERAREVSTA